MPDTTFPEFIAATLPPPLQWRGKVVYRADLGIHQFSDGAQWNPVGALTAAQVQAVQALVAGPQAPSAGSTTVSVAPQIAKALWFPLNEGAGTTVLDRIQGLTATVGGTVTNLWANPGEATFDTTTGIYGASSIADELFRLDTLTAGSIIIGADMLIPGNPSANVHWFGYGPNSDTAIGGYSGALMSSGAVALGFCTVGGTASQFTGPSLAIGMLAKQRRFQTLAIHSFGGMRWVDYYEGGRHIASLRWLGMEAGTPPGVSPYGYRIGCRSGGAASSNASQIGGGWTLPRMSNFFAVRIDSDQRGRIPGWINNAAQTMPYGLVPAMFSGG